MAPKKNRSPRLDKQLAGHIKWLWLNTPMNQAQISAALGAINQGRVSEVLNGLRYPDVGPLPFEGGF